MLCAARRPPTQPENTHTPRFLTQWGVGGNPTQSLHLHPSHATQDAIPPTFFHVRCACVLLPFALSSPLASCPTCLLKPPLAASRAPLQLKLRRALLSGVTPIG